MSRTSVASRHPLQGGEHKCRRLRLQQISQRGGGKVEHSRCIGPANESFGVVVSRRADCPLRLVSFVLGSDGAGACSLYVPAGGSRQPASAETVAQREHYVQMQGRDVFRFATRVLPDSVLQALQAAKLTTDDIDLLIPHQANTRIIDAAVRRLKLSDSVVFSNVERYGNTSAASIPVALCEALEGGLVQPGATLVLSGFGAGLSWGTAVWKWQG